MRLCKSKRKPKLEYNIEILALDGKNRSGFFMSATLGTKNVTFAYKSFLKTTKCEKENREFEKNYKNYKGF